MHTDRGDKVVLEKQENTKCKYYNTCGSEENCSRCKYRGGK